MLMIKCINSNRTNLYIFKVTFRWKSLINLDRCRLIFAYSSQSPLILLLPTDTPTHLYICTYTKLARGELVHTILCCHHASHASIERILSCRYEIEASLVTTVKSAGICFLDLFEQLSRARRKGPWLHLGTRKACTRTSAISFSFES